MSSGGQNGLGRAFWCIALGVLALLWGGVSWVVDAVTPDEPLQVISQSDLIAAIETTGVEYCGTSVNARFGLTFLLFDRPGDCDDDYYSDEPIEVRSGSSRSELDDGADDLAAKYCHDGSVVTYRNWALGGASTWFLTDLDGLIDHC